jgi:3-oxoacyl-[acyl-carrier protein] reductase
MTTADEVPSTERVAVVTGETFEATIARQALNRRLTPADTAAAVAFLASDGAAALTGQVLCVDGGLVLR